MRFLLRFGIPLLATLALLSVALTPLASGLMGRWFQRDLQMRSHLIFSAIEPAVSQLAEAGDTAQIAALFESVAKDERVLSIAWCDPARHIRVQSSLHATSVCPEAAGEPTFQTSREAGKPVLLAVFPMPDAAGALGQLLIAQDLSFVESRSTTAQIYLMAFLGLFSIIAAGVTMIIARLTLRGWIKSMRGFLKGGATSGDDPEIGPIIGEIRQMVRDLDMSRRTSSSIRVDWSPETLRRVLASELTGTQVIVVSNREPYIHNRTADGKIVMQRPASGMVTALEPIMRACGGTWIAHGSGSADREVSDGADRIAVPPNDPAYTLKRVWLSEPEQDGYYYGLANEGLWPLCHITFVRPVFRESDWLQYKAVNRKFADAVIAEATRPDPVILVQDYHFALLPGMIRERLPHATIITFWHIPWPNAEVFGICPWREEILAGLLGSTVVGFHTQLHCNNFIETADRFIECHIDREDAVVSVGGQSALVRPYPISIAWPPDALQGQPPPEICRAQVFARFGLRANTILAAGVERFDFTKGIPDRFRAVEILLERHPELIGRFVLLQVAAPTRGKLAAYQDIKAESEAAAAAVNRRFGGGGYQPILLVVGHYEPDQVFELFRAADACIVSSLHDGMNLVAKEFVAARDDERGVLILSSFAGASRELMEALIVNPFDARASAEAIFRAVGMSAAEQERRMRLMRDMVSENNIYYWAGRMLLDAARIRKRRQLESTLAVASRWQRRSA
ncbi:MAG: alpha,alpha-trehalose-phosphate synthase (UDP-forming) [Rhodospirillaceae bacterium]